MRFEVDSRIQTSSFWLGEWPLSSVYLKNDANFPWIILVPRVDDVQEIYQLSKVNRYLLMDEMAMLSTIMSDFFKPDKLNVGALGNIVSQLHLHVVARFKSDKVWPHSVWQSGITAAPYTSDIIELTQSLSKALNLTL